MSYILAYPVAFGAALPTTAIVLALWVLHARMIDGNSADSVFLPFVFLFVPLIFFVSVASNLAAVALGQITGLIAPSLATAVTIGAAFVLVWCACAWTQRGLNSLRSRAAAPVTALPVALFGLADMLILGGSLQLLPRHAL